MTRLRLQRLGIAVFTVAMLVGLAFPATRHAATVGFVAGVLFTVVTAIRPATRGGQP